jgi:hypothetical protein
VIRRSHSRHFFGSLDVFIQLLFNHESDEDDSEGTSRRGMTALNNRLPLREVTDPPEAYTLRATLNFHGLVQWYR